VWDHVSSLTVGNIERAVLALYIRMPLGGIFGHSNLEVLPYFAKWSSHFDFRCPNPEGVKIEIFQSVITAACSSPDKKCAKLFLTVFNVR
jgi:hypothetical protein